MPRRLFRTFVLALSLSLTVSALPVVAQTAYAVTGLNQLVRFNLATPHHFASTLPITGLGASEVIRAIDFRPATGELYALGSLGRLYVLNLDTGAATQVGTSGAFTLNGTLFGLDFNPVVDRIRLVGTSDQNVRLNPSTGALAATDTPLAYAVGDVNQGTNPNVEASAYTSNFAGAPATTLFGIDIGTDTLVIQNPPNNGTLTTVGPLGADASAASFDIATVGGVDVGYAVLQSSAGIAWHLYRINLATGAATLIGPLGAGAIIYAFAIAPETPRLVNIATRGLVLTGENVMIAGFVLGGSGNKTVAIVATGPSLAAYGIASPLANPTLTLVRSSDQAVIATNDDWQGGCPPGFVCATPSQLTATGFAPSHPLEAAILITLPPGAYTAIVQGSGGGTGVAVVAVYEVGGT